MAHKKAFSIGLFNYVTSYILLIVSVFASFFPTVWLFLLPAAIHNYYGYVLSDIPGSAAALYNVAVAASYVYWLSLPIIAVITIVALKKQKVIFWLPLAYLIVNIILFFVLQAQPYWDGFVV